MASQALSPLRDTWRALNDTTRVRLMALLRRAELSVSELRDVTLLSQSLISAHLAVLRKVDLVVTRKEGKSIYYTARTDLAKPVESIVEAALGSIEDVPETREDRDSLTRVLGKRRKAAQNYFNKIAGKLGKAYCPGRTWSAVGPMLAHMLGDWDIADLGAGEGWLTLLLAQRARSVTAIDNSPKMVEYGIAHMKENKIRNVEFKLGDLEDPPLSEASMDLIVYSQALHHVEDPAGALLRGVEALRPGGRCVVLDLLKHPHDKARRLYHDRWLGFTESDLEDWFKKAGLLDVRIQTLEPDPNEPGYVPVLASGRR